MATIPPLKLTRDQLASFLQDFEQIKQFENLFATVQTLAPIVGQDFEYQADNAAATANEALALISALAKEASLNSWSAENKAVQALDAIDRVTKLAQLQAYAPVAQNNNSVKTDYVDFNPSAPYPADVPGRAYWNEDDGTLDVDQYGGTVLQVGQEVQYYAKNTSGVLVTNGTPVMFTGTVGSSAKLEFGLAVADGSVPADYMMGVATQDIGINEFGYITHFGIVRGFNTTGSPYGEVWADGDLLYFDPATPGTWTNVAPLAPNIDVPVAVVLNAGSGGSGSIFVRMTVAEALSRLQDVYINGLSDRDRLIYIAANSRWERAPQVRIGTVASSASITINADDFDQYNITALAVDSTINAPSGTPLEGQKLIIRILDNGVSRNLTWNGIFRVIGTTLPASTTATKTSYIGCIYNGAATTWDVVAVTTEV